MFKKWVVFSVLLVFVISLAGCATTSARKQSELDIQGLRNQVSVLEAQIQSKDEEIGNLKEALNKTVQENEALRVVKISTGRAPKHITRKKIVSRVKSRPNTKQIQIALRSAGFEPGSIDGKMGRQTREAIKAFQKAHGLPQTGKVNKATWNLLRDYLYKKLK